VAEQELFTQDESERLPLAARMRPRTLDEFIGQEHILGPGRLLRRAIQADMLSSLIFSGPPGTGKTTLARVIANTTRSAFTTLNAVLGGVAEARRAVEEAQETYRYHGRRTILFVDEVHRWNKAQQDALLPWVENGTVILIGATTENPFFEVNSPLVSRSRVFQLKPLEESHLRDLARRALSDPERGYGRYDVTVDEEALDHLVRVADGDARSLLNALQLAVETTSSSFPPPPGEAIYITLEVAEESIQRKALLYDKEGDYHFDAISAFIKSMRGSDPDAALYWLARMVAAGEDPRYLFRRMLILASEDVGPADPQALVVTEAAAAAFDRVGMPEGQYHLTHAALYLATCEKSNTALGYFDALSAVREERSHDVPRHLRDDNRDAADFGHGEGYRYPHAYREHWVAQQYLPAGLTGRVFYRPGRQGWEGARREQIERRRELQLAQMLAEPDDAEETFTATPGRRDPAPWLARISEEAGRLRDAVRERVAALLEAKRHHRILVWEADAALLLWDAVRSAPEGISVGVVGTKRGAEAARGLAEQIDPLERPAVAAGLPSALDQTTPPLSDLSAGIAFERIVADRLVTRALARRPSASAKPPGAGTASAGGAGDTSAEAGASARGTSAEAVSGGGTIAGGTSAGGEKELPRAGDEENAEEPAEHELRSLLAWAAPEARLILVESAPSRGPRLSRLMAEVSSGAEVHNGTAGPPESAEPPSPASRRRGSAPPEAAGSSGNSADRGNRESPLRADDAWPDAEASRNARTSADNQAVKALAHVEDRLFSPEDDPAARAAGALEALGVVVEARELVEIERERTLEPRELQAWLDPEHGSYGRLLREELGDERAEAVAATATAALSGRNVKWHSIREVIVARLK